MNRIKALLAIILTAACVAISAPAVAQQSDAGWYIGAAYGMTTIDVDMAGITNPSLDDSDSGFKIYGGFQFNRHFAAEIGYVDGGKATFGGSIPSLGIPPFTGDLAVSAFTIAAVGTLPLNESFALFGKVGMAAWDVTTSVSFSGAGGSLDDSGTDAFFGAGVRYNLNKNWGLVLEVEQYDTESSVTMTSLGVRYTF